MKARILYGSIFLLIIILFSLLSRRKTSEGFTGSFAECKAKGFTTEFCVQTPIATMGVGTCLCEDGNLGLQMPGFGGQCVCQQALANPLYR
tara:strand:+ start:6273 stop:6545 length:273 start_codon:yes stop_codon:yes gene_type:complete